MISEFIVKKVLDFLGINVDNMIIYCLLMDKLGIYLTKKTIRYLCACNTCNNKLSLAPMAHKLIIKKITLLN